MEEAMLWYECQAPGVGGDFLDACDRAFQQIQERPDSYVHVGNGFRRAIMERFPFVIFYEFDDHHVVVNSVFHTARNPEVWKKQLGLD